MPPLEFRNLRIDFGTQIRGSLAQHRPGSDTDAEARCRLEMPVLRDLGDGRRVACHREE